MVNRPMYEELEQTVRDLKKEVAETRATEAALREKQERLSQIIQTSSIPTFVIDHRHAITHWNRACEILTGIPEKKMLGTRKQWMAFYSRKRPVMADLLVDNAPEAEIAGYYGGSNQEFAIKENAFEAERFFPDLGDSGKWLFITAAPLRDSDGKVTGAIETLQDVTARKRAEDHLRKSERRLQTLLDFVPYPIVVFTLEGHVYYLNPSFTKTFGWTFRELEGKPIPYFPPGLDQETRKMIKKLSEEKVILRYETKRLTKDGRTLDVVIRAGLYSESGEAPAGELVILRDVTREKKIARNNEAILRISRALPEYPDLEGLLDYVSREVKGLLDTEGALVILTDEERRELFFQGAAYDDTDTQKKIKEIRFPADKSVAGKVIRTGRPVIVADTSKDPDFYPGVDKKLGYHTRNLLEVPLRSFDRIIGVLGARNKKENAFDQTDVELLDMIAGTVALSIENARFSEEIKKAYRNNEALLRISMALPEYPDLEELLDYVSREVKRLLDSEGALVILLDQEKEELFFPGAAYDDTATQKRVKEIRFPVDELVAGQVIKSGEPIIVSHAPGETGPYSERDKKLGYHTRNLLQVPLKSIDRIIGVLCAINKKGDEFDQTDVGLLNMIAGTVALSIENARFSEEIKKAYRELSSLDRAKDKVINHLSHELKTPVSVLAGSLNILKKRMAPLPEETWISTLGRAERNLDRIIEIQNEVEDIMRDRHYKVYDFLSLILDQCADELETLIAEQEGEDNVIEGIKKRVEEIFGPRDLVSEEIHLDEFVGERIRELRKSFSTRRRVEIINRIEPAPIIYMPAEPLQKTIDGLVKNAIENTPDEGKIEVIVRKKEEGAELVVRDHGVGLTRRDQQRIFEGFFTTQDTMDYSSKRPFDFNAGGKGADLLRMRIFSERYNFKIGIESSRCRFISKNDRPCPGRISDCPWKDECHSSGGASFFLWFPGIQGG